MNLRAHRTTPATLFFDASCGMCAGLAERWGGFLRRRGLAVVPLQSLEARQALGLAEGELPGEMKLVGEAGMLGGAEALLEIARRSWWSRPLAMLGSLPLVRPLLRRAYAAVARRRHCPGGSCNIKNARGSPKRQWIGWLPLLLIPFPAWALRNLVPDWLFTWVLAVLIFASCKWLTWWRAGARAHASMFRSLAYLLAWVGMDAEAFLRSEPRPARPCRSEWMAATFKTLLGAALVWVVARTIPTEPTLLRAWCGLVGLINLHHFGLFHLLSLMWRANGVDASPIMRAPPLARSLGEFWNARWNLAFHKIADRLVFRPLLRRSNLSCALLATFALSGLVHDVVISLPARGGYGGPTGYFLLQGAGVWFERTAEGRKLGLANGLRGRAFAWFMTLAPLPLLVPEAFLTRVILPFLQIIHAL